MKLSLSRHVWLFKMEANGPRSPIFICLNHNNLMLTSKALTPSSSYMRHSQCCGVLSICVARSVCRKLEQDHRERLSVVRSDLMKDMELMQQQNDQRRETLEAELEKIREDESFLRDHLSISLQVHTHTLSLWI